MVLLRRADAAGPVWYDNWPRARRLPLVGSAAELTLKDAIRRYVNGEIAGRSFLIAGHRGAGKTTLVRSVVEDLIDEILQREDLRARSPIKPDSILAMPQRPLLVRLHGPSLLLDELPGPGAGETPAPAVRPDAPAAGAAPSQDQAGAAADTAAIPPAAAPVANSQKPEVAQSTLVQVTIALWRALAAECAGAFQIHARAMQAPHRRSGLEIAAQLQLELDQAPEPALLRSYWSRFDALESGVLWPTNVGQAMSDAGFGGQGFREIVAVATTAQIFEVCAGKVEFSKTKKDTSQVENRTGLDSGQAGGKALADALGRLPGLGLGAALGAGAAGSLSQSLPLSLAGGLLGALALSWTSTRVQARANGLDYSIVLDRSVTTLERDLPVAIDRIRQAGLAPIFVVDELDKIDAVEGTITTLIRRLKQLTTDDAVFCFLTDREYFATVQRKVEREAYPVEHTFFSERLYVLHAPEDLDRYIDHLFAPIPQPPPMPAAGIPEDPGRRDVLDQAALRRKAELVVAKLILHASKLNMTDATRALARGWQDGVWREEPADLIESSGNRLRVALQLAVEHVLRSLDSDARIERDGSFRQLLVDALYIVSRAWEQNSPTVSLRRQDIAGALLKRMGKTPNGAPFDSLLDLVGEADAISLVEAVRSLQSYLHNFDHLRDALQGAPDIRPSLLDVIPPRSGLLVLEDEQVEHGYRFRFDAFGRGRDDKGGEKLTRDEVASLSSLLDFVRALRLGLKTLELSLDDLVAMGDLPRDMSDKETGRRQSALGPARDDEKSYEGYLSDKAGLIALRQVFFASSAEVYHAIAFGFSVSRDAGASASATLRRGEYRTFLGQSFPFRKLAGVPVASYTWEDNARPAFFGFGEAWFASLSEVKASLSSSSPHPIDWSAAWNRRARELAEGLVAPVAGEIWHYDDLVLLVQQAWPVCVVQRPLSALSVAERSLLTLEAALAAANDYWREPKDDVPTWLAIPALHALGFGGDMLTLITSALKQVWANGPENEAVALLLTKLPAMTEPSGAGFVTLVDDTGHPAADVAGPVRAPVFFLTDSQSRRYIVAVDWLTDRGIFKGVIDERRGGGGS